MTTVTKFKLALIQLAVGPCKGDNLLRAVQKIREAATRGAQLVALPECFNSPYGPDYFADYAEELGTGETSIALSTAAKDNSIYLIGGSFPERKDGKIYNSCTIWDPNGLLITLHRKMHLFDVDIPGRIRFQESETLSPGSDLTCFDFGNICKIGVGICYDIQFPEMALLYADAGCKLLVYPGAFNMTTGPAHWEILQRCRALDNQVYVAAVSPARVESSSYVAWGHSSVVSPWAEVVATTDHLESIIYADIDLDYLDQIRQEMPLRKQRRTDVYKIVGQKKEAN